MRNGAEILSDTTVLALESGDGEVEVITDHVTVRAKRAVVSTGAWFTDLIPELRLPLRIQRSCLAWFKGDPHEAFGPGQFPPFVRKSDHLDGWGIPDVDGRGVKVGAGPSAEKRWLDRPEDNWTAPTEFDLAPILAFVREDLPGLQIADSYACMNSRTSDRDFVIGISKENPDLVLLGGFSGHGFKHSAGIGRIAADLALESATDIAIDRFSPDRFAAVA